MAVFTAGSRDVSHLDAEVVHVSTNLADRDALRRDLVDADTYLVELKAAAIDVVVEHALAHRVVVCARRERGWSRPASTSSCSACSRQERCRHRIGRRCSRAGGGPGRLTQRRRGEPLPLGDGGLPYSKGLMARALIAVGVPADHAYQLARRIELDLAERGISAIEVDRLDEIAREVLGEQEGERVFAGRLRRLDDLQALDVPIVLMIGGSTGDRQVDRRGRSGPPTGSESHVSRQPTSSGRRCGPSSRPSSCRRSTSRASRPGRRSTRR